jgi:hypothetical protein
MLRRLSLGISYFIATVYLVSILLPSVYCVRRGCRGPAELDAFMPAFMLTPLGAIGTAFSLHNSIEHIRNKSGSWFFWPLAVIFAIVLFGVAALITLIVYETVIRR